jgi:hypothetical protein
MLTAERLRACRGVDGIAALFGELGYPVAPIPLAPEEWRRAGIDVPWNGRVDFRLLARMRRFDLFLLTAAEAADEEALLRFLRSYRDYNVITKSSLIYWQQNYGSISIYDISEQRKLRRLDVSLAAPTWHALDRLNLLSVSSPANLPRLFNLALDRESVTRRFFERFRGAVSDVFRSLSAGSREPSEVLHAEALLILSRLLFLSFVQEKGWLNGERRFLADRLEQCARSGDEFFSTVLLPLFFGCLNTPAVGRDNRALALGRIPYLNGGLFEPSAFERRHPDLHLSNSLMQRVIISLFEKFDFRSDESDSAGSHVDPEMLGKVFESLMASDERAATGSFYTPRAIVDALITGAIAEWLVAGDATLRTQVDSLLERSESGRPRVASNCRPPESGNPLTPDAARALLGRLESIALLDPTCGSGAFLLSSLVHIEKLTRSLSEIAGVEVDRDLRQSIVERSLFGVDLKPEAVRLCELRLWLAIVSPCELAIEDVRPLPNLDRNIMQGSSLFSPTDFLGDGRGEIYRRWRYAVLTQGDLVARYRCSSQLERPALARMIRDNDRGLATDLLMKAIDLDQDELMGLSTPERDLFGRVKPLDRGRCIELQERVAGNRRSLERIEEGTLDFFSFDIHFAQVMARGGFDVIAGNPPWVRNGRIDARTKQMVSDRYPLFAGSNGAGFHQPDLSVAFCERALSLCSPGGVVTLLMPAKIANANYASALRRALGRMRIASIRDWSSAPKKHFEADTFPLGLTVVNAAAAEQTRVRIAADEEEFAVEQRKLPAGGAGSEWLLVPPEVGAIVQRLRREHAPLIETLGRKPLMGVKTGENSVFFLDDVRIGRRAAFADGAAIPLHALSRCVRGRDLKRWSAEASVWMLWPPPDSWRHPPRWLERFAAVRGVEPASLRLSYVKPEHIGIKVAWKDVSRGMCAAVLAESIECEGRLFPLVPNQTLYFLDAVSVEEACVICALLNSTVAGALLLATAERAKDAHFRYFGRTVGGMPLPHITPEVAQWSALLRMARQAGRGADVSGELDCLAASMYGVSEGELRTLRGFVARRLGRHAG